MVGFVEAPALGLDLPLDVRGTAFQQRVWQALQHIPAGQTASYSDIAARIGAPKSTRAVAQACGANALAVATEQIAAMADPVGQIDQLTPLPSGISAGRMRIPLGVIMMVYEARPNVTVEAAALALKSGNVVLLRGGKEAIEAHGQLRVFC